MQVAVPHGLKPTQSKSARDLYQEAMAEIVRPYPSIRLPSWQTFNRVTGGFRVKEYSILCGPTGVGKTTFLANLSAELLGAACPQLVMSVETGGTDYLKRMISTVSGVDVNTGDPINEGVAHEIHENYGEQFLTDQIQLTLYENRVSVEQIMFDIRFHHERDRTKVVLLDNLNFFMEPTRASDWNLEMDRVTHELIVFCKQVNVHIVMVMHPRKTDGCRVENEFDIKGSSTAVQEAHNIFLLNRPREDELKDGSRHPTDREVKICKMRRRGHYVGSRVFFGCHQATYRELER